VPNGFDSPDDLIAELQNLAAEVEPVDAVAFGAEARDELAAYREQRDLVSRRDREPVPKEIRERRKPAIVVPETYESQAEFFLVFDTFVRFFIHPFIVANAIPGLVEESLKEGRIDRIAFRRFGEEMEDARNIEELRTLSDDIRELTAIAGSLGRTLFGDRFRASDFWSIG